MRDIDDVGTLGSSVRDPCKNYGLILDLMAKVCNDNPKGQNCLRMKPTVELSMLNCGDK